MNIIEPSQYEKDKAIEDILSKGLSKPKSLLGYLGNLYSALGFRYIFFEMAFPIVMTVIATICFIVLYPLTLEQHLYATLFAIAPLFFLFIVLFTETMEQINGLYELKMTCKYTILQIAAFRVLCFSFLGTMFCTFISLYFSRLSAVYSFFKTVSLSLCALFLCAFLAISLMRHFNWKWIHFSAMLLWITLSFMPIWILGERWELFLSQIPAAITMFAAVIACSLFLMEIKKLMNTHKREVAYYVGY